MRSSPVGDVLWFLRIRSLLRHMFIAVALVGAFSVQRLAPGLEDLGPLAEPRSVIGALFAGFALLGWSAGAGRGGGGRVLAFLIFGFVSLHALVACSYFWAFDPWFAPQQLEDLSILVLSVFGFVALFGDDPLSAVRISIRVAIWLAIVVEALWAVSGFEQGAYGIGGIGAARLFGVAVLAASFLRYRSGRVSYLFILVPLLGGMLVSGSRATLLALLPALGVVWLGRVRIAGGAVRGTTREVVGVIFAIAAIVVLALIPAGSEVFDQVVLSIFGPPGGSGGAQGVYLADRDVIFSHALSTFMESPISGLGVGTYRGPFGEEYPHNLLLAYAVDAGIVAVLMFSGLLLCFAFLAFRARSPLEIFAVAFAVFTLVASMFAGSYYDARMFWFMFAALAMQAGFGNGAGRGAGRPFPSPRHALSTSDPVPQSLPA
jgi:O-antigen ligase